MEIYEKPTFLPSTVEYFQMVDNVLESLGEYENFCILAIRGKLESSSVGIYFNIYAAQSSIDFVPKFNDIIKIDDQNYQVISKPLYQKGHSVFSPFYVLNAKTVSNNIFD